MKVQIPNEWSDVTVSEFQQLAALSPDQIPNKRIVSIISILTNIENPLLLDNGTIREISEMLTFMNTPITKERFESFSHNGKHYEWIGGFDEITIGEQISIEQSIQMEELNYSQSFDLVMAVLLREKGVEFDASKIKENRDLYSSFPVDVTHGMILFFLSGGLLFSRTTVRYSVVPKMKILTNGLKKKQGLMKRLKKKVLAQIINGLRWLIGLQRMILQNMTLYLK